MLSHAISLVLIAWAVAAALMALLWLWHLRLRNAAVVDVGWAGGLAIAALIAGAIGGGNPVRRWLTAWMMTVWGARLALYLLWTRVIGKPEDSRYAELRRSHGSAWFFFFFQAQALLVAWLSWPIAVTTTDANPHLSPLLWIGVAVWVAALVGESVADTQLNAFKANPANRGHTCQGGLWRYSRHPNYFFEWLVWIAYALIALPSPGGTLAVLCPALMLFLLFRVTGIPATEAQAVRSRGDAYREYQRTTSAFVPWFRRGESTHEPHL